MPDFVRRIPEGDNRERLICADCGHIAYDNPKVVVGSVVVADDAVLMCRRAIEPRRGFWTLPAGYLEHGETLEEGAAREAWEEAQAEIALDGILGVFSISRIGQVQVIFRARFASPGAPRFAAGAESLEVALFTLPRIPRDEIAFPSVIWALDAWQRAGSGSARRARRQPSVRSARYRTADATRLPGSAGDARVGRGGRAARHRGRQSTAPVAGAAGPASPSADGPVRAGADRDSQAPPDNAGQGPRVSLRDFRVRRFNQGLGYAPGSQFETSEEKRTIQTPGLTVQVPLR